MHRRDAGKAEIMIQEYTCPTCGYHGPYQFQSDGYRRPPTSVACLKCKTVVLLAPSKWTVRGTTAQFTPQPPDRGHPV